MNSDPASYYSKHGIHVDKKVFWRRGEPYVWVTGGGLSLILLMALVLVFIVMTNGLNTFWTKTVYKVETNQGLTRYGERTKEESVVVESTDANGKIIREPVERFQLKVGNRDLYRLDFAWFNESDVKTITEPKDVFTLERLEYGNFYGTLVSIEGPEIGTIKPATIEDLKKLRQASAIFQDELDEAAYQVTKITRMQKKVELELRYLAHNGVQKTSPEYAEIQMEEKMLQTAFAEAEVKRNEINKKLKNYKAVFADAEGREKTVPAYEIVRAYQPNTFGLGDKLALYGSKTWELFFDEPRESNTEGGLFPAIFGTVMLIVLMSILFFPLGVMAGIYLSEYAKQGLVVRLVRIAVNNLAGIPSIVYGIFGLGFFVYTLGATIDNVFYSHLPDAKFGTGGILWASCTLGLLTIPVVIVSTEEALGAIPKGIREGSLALGATKFQTLCRTLLPMSVPGIMTGFILAMSRAAGEVAPLMITGVVKLAPTLPIDASFPFGLERKFMHLGFHIYDVGFQAPNVEAARPMVYVTTLLLLGIVLILCSVAIVMRNRLQKKLTIRSI